MVEVNRSASFPNATNETSFPFVFCTGSYPSKSFQITLYSTLMALSLIGNLLVIAAFYRNKTLRTAVYYFIVNMAISDLITSMIDLPWWISTIYHDGLWLVDGVLGTILCKLVHTAWEISTFVSILSLLGIAADRFHAVLFPMKSALFSQNKRRLTIAAIWVVSVACWAHLPYGAKLVPYGTGLRCTLQWKPASYKWEVFRINWILLFCLTLV